MNQDDKAHLVSDQKPADDSAAGSSSASSVSSSCTDTQTPDPQIADPQAVDSQPAADAVSAGESNAGAVPPDQGEKTAARSTGGKRSAGSALALIALLVSVAVAAGGYWLHHRLMQLEQVRDSQAQAAVDAALAAQNERVTQQLDTLEQRLNEAQAAVDAQLRDAAQQQNAAQVARQELQARVEGRLAAVDAQQARIEALQQRMDTLLERIDSLRREQQPTVMLRWQAAQDLLAVGRLQAQQLYDLDSAIQHYQAARQLLLDQADANAAQVIAVLDEELQRLRAVDVVDRDQLQQEVRQLAAGLAQWVPAVAQTQSPPPADAGWWDKLKFQAGRVITVRRANILDQVDVAVLRQVLRVHLLAAQAALVAGDGAGLRRHAGHAHELLQTYGAETDAWGAAALESLAALAAVELTRALPALGQAEQQLEQLLRATRLEEAA